MVEEATAARAEAPKPLVLVTKLARPPHRPDVVARTRLTERISNALSGKLTLISAPPGFGKTTLVTEWLAGYAQPERVGWVSLDPGDSDPGRFFSYFVRAIRSVEPEFGAGLLNVLQTGVRGDATLVLVDLINALNQLQEQVVCVLDDYHVISSDDVHRSMAYLLEHQPAHLHIVITSRETPPLPLSLLRSRREMTEFRAADLRFSLDETTAFFNQIMGFELSPERVQALEQRTEGWIAGLLLAALSAGDADEPEMTLERFGGEHRFVFDYLAEEVFRRQPPDAQRFLEQTAVLGRMSADLVRELTGEGQERLDYLVESNLFTIPLDSDRSWYRYHQLFGEFLAARLRERDHDGWKDAHHRASVWFEANGHISEAVEHALAAGDEECLARLIEQDGYELVRHGRTATLERWLSGLTEPTIVSRPRLILLRVWVLMFSRSFEEIPSWFERVDSSVIEDDEERAEFRSYQAVCEATFARFRADIDEIIRLSTEALDYFSTLPPGSNQNECIALLHLGGALRMRGDTLQSIEVLTKAIERGRPGENRVVELNALSQLTASYGELGAFREAERWARSTIEREQEYGMRRLAMAEASRISLATILREREAFDEARALLDDVILSIQRTGDREDLGAQILSLYERALVEVDARNPSAARATMEDALNRARHLQFAPDSHWRVVALKAHIHLLMGQPGPAVDWAAERPFPDEAPIDYLNERAAITRAWVDLDTGKAERSDRLLRRLIAGLEEAGRAYRLAEARLMLAAVSLRLGRESEAVEFLDKAVAYAADSDCRRLLVDTHPDVGALLPLAVRRANKMGLDLRLPAELTGDNGVLTEVVPEEALTAREREVLELVGEGISNREIAERLYVSVGTVKRHTHNIYRKLGVSNRTQAMVRSQELGLVGRD